MPARMILWCQKANTILQTPVLAAVMQHLFHTEVYDTIWLNGGKPMLGRQTLGSYSTFATPNYGMWLSVFFGVVKGRWQILTRPPEYDMDIQARVPSALAALHNSILKHDSIEWDKILDDDVEDPNPGTRREDIDSGDLADGATTAQEKRRSEARRDEIAQAMWESYQEYLRQENLDGNV
ncbi:DDE Tnp4 domain-containing protein [Mycena venus]|uniref:DDE Tnp4 domain-containing protein n=1 Tax=Mycena venus TaxID=2733690 RepID=A0A8H6ZAV6_9AGAR|nr:DDE Tnp4 domain-containing protein [Mycena venus]